jgi:hypothetical protein
LFFSTALYQTFSEAGFERFEIYQNPNTREFLTRGVFYSGSMTTLVARASTISEGRRRVARLRAISSTYVGNVGVGIIGSNGQIGNMDSDGYIFFDCLPPSDNEGGKI